LDGLQLARLQHLAYQVLADGGIPASQAIANRFGGSGSQGVSTNGTDSEDTATP